MRTSERIPRRYRRFLTSLEFLEGRRLLATFAVESSADSGPFTLRQAILDANARPGPDNIVFNLPTPQNNPNNRFVDFSAITQTWRISLNTPLPSITDQATIDGLTQANIPIPYLYPEQDPSDPAQIVSSASTVAAKEGNDAANRVIIDGQFGQGTGFDILAPNTIIRGLNIERFQIGVSISAPGAVVQGNSIGRYFVYPVNTDTGDPLPGAAAASLDGAGNSGPGILIGSTNATIGGRNPQEANIIAGNGGQGVLVVTDSVGNLIAGNQIGIAGPTTTGLFAVAGNGDDGIRIESYRPDSFGPPNTSSSTTVDLNLISGNRGDGINVVGPGVNQRPPTPDSPLEKASTRINITGNYIGVGPGGGFAFGSPDTGNAGDGIWIDHAAVNRIGGSSDRDRNVVAGNEGAGVRITGSNAVNNDVIGNYVGVTDSGAGALGNSREGVIVNAPDNTIGPGNLISANLRGVLILSTVGTPTNPVPETIQASRNIIRDNRIGTDSTGSFDLGNALEGVLIVDSSGNQVLGNAAGSQVVSGNDVGILVIGAASGNPSQVGNIIQGNFIGTTSAGTSDLGNSLEGVRIENSAANLVGGTSAAARNVISANHWGVTIAGGGSVANVIQGNSIGTDVSGNAQLGNEIDGVLIFGGASGNLIGGGSTAAGNIIAYNHRNGVRIEGPSVNNAILTNRIFRSGQLGIDLVRPEDATISSSVDGNRIPPPFVNPNDPGDPDEGPNRLQNAPQLTSVGPGTDSTRLRGILNSTPNTSFLIQFFVMSPPDRNGYGEGDVYIGETSVTTDANGNASFSLDVSVVITDDQQVTATATDPVGNTSEFSGAGSIQSPTVAFTMAGYSVNEAAGQATILVERNGDARRSVTISYTTVDGTARAGSDYLPVTGTLTFGPGDRLMPITIPILLNPEVEETETVLLTLSNPTGGAILGQPATAVLSIVDDAADRTGPSVISARAVGGRLGVAAVILTFSESLDPARAVDLVNYGYGVRIAGRDGRLGTRDDLLIGIASASYDPVGRTVTLLLGRPILKKTAMQVAINQATDNPSAGVGVADVSGNLIDGNGDGRPGGAYVTRVVAKPVPRRPRVGGRPGKAHHEAR